MIHQNSQSEKRQTEFFYAIKALNINKFLRESRVTKQDGYRAFDMFKYLLLLVFEGKNLSRILSSHASENMPHKDAFYRFLNRPIFAWRRFLIKLSSHVIYQSEPLTSSHRPKVLIIDDSLFSRARSKKVELLSRVYDHASA